MITDLSYHLAQRYTRPDSSIMIRVDHSACLALGGTFDPCYILNINAVPSQMGPSTNKRNSALIQSFMADILSVPAERGIITFMPIPEESLAMNGNTVLGEMEKFEKQDPSAMKKMIQDAHRKSQTFTKKSMPKLNGEVNGVPESSSSSEKDQNPPARIVTAPDSDIVELPASEGTRPSTANGSYAAENGLRMNGISTEELKGKNSRTPNGRPKTFGAPATASVPEQVKREPLPQRQSASQTQTTSKSEQPKAKHTPLQQKAQEKSQTTVNQVPPTSRPVQKVQQSTNGTKSTKPTTQRSSTTPTPVSTSTATEKRTKNTYLDNVSTLTAKGTEPSKTPSPDPPTRPDSAATTASANTAKRRSTITATPKMPAPAPPPMPNDKEESKSMSSRLSKRKSFFKGVFKRESVPAWYKQ